MPGLIGLLCMFAVVCFVCDKIDWYNNPGNSSKKTEDSVDK
jgi:hypothetical protein